MSNSNVGSVYQKIIQDVGETSRVDFEESGVDDVVLRDMMKLWQAKLSQTGVAQWPWDPKAEPNQSPAIPSSGPPPQNAPNYQQPQGMAPVPQQHQPQQQPPPQFIGMPPANHPHVNGPSIKQEPGLEAQALGNYPPTAAFNQAQSAQERAALNLQHTYGPRAAASINALQSAGPMPQQQRPMQMQIQPMHHPQQAGQNGQHIQSQQQHQMQRPNMGQTPQQAQEAAYRLQMAQRTAQQMAVKNNGGQTDGADEIQPGSVGTISRFNAQGEEVELGRIEIDHMIRRRIEAMGQSMEGGGLMRPVGKQVFSDRPKKQRVGNSSVPQTDGPDDDGIKDEEDIKDEDEDAINSDLDDPEEKDMDDDEDDEGANTMLCMYDKVQRVKNKWKCIMKDGVITVDGKEFVFHKATGEYEW